MGLSTNTIVVLENQERYIILNQTMYTGKKYFLAMGIDENKELITSKVVILEEIVSGLDLFVEKVIDQETIKTLTRLFKAQN
ncbi:MAG: hypothetical protein IJN03_00980 [Bacilli bacterium]|nr:hypothetical protein [Bacilli bacterium]